MWTNEWMDVLYVHSVRSLVEWGRDIADETRQFVNRRVIRKYNNPLGDGYNSGMFSRWRICFIRARETYNSQADIVNILPAT